MDEQEVQVKGVWIAFTAHAPPCRVLGGIRMFLKLRGTASV